MGEHGHGAGELAGQPSQQPFQRTRPACAESGRAGVQPPVGGRGQALRVTPGAIETEAAGRHPGQAGRQLAHQPAELRGSPVVCQQLAPRDARDEPGHDIGPRPGRLAATDLGHGQPWCDRREQAAKANAAADRRARRCAAHRPLDHDPPAVRERHALGPRRCRPRAAQVDDLDRGLAEERLAEERLQRAIGRQRRGSGPQREAVEARRDRGRWHGPARDRRRRTCPPRRSGSRGAARPPRTSRWPARPRGPARSRRAARGASCRARGRCALSRAPP